jgi:hypothetical protein
LKTHNFDEAPFSKFFGNVYSQNGEDGVIEEILSRIGWSNLSLWVAEFGAWDGQHLSNTFSLVETRDFNSVYIEGDSEKFIDLVLTAKRFPRIVPIEAMISSRSGQANSLDNLLAKTEIPSDFDILSIDIDSYDLDIWESLSNYQPKIVVIEINSGIMPGILSRHNKIYEGNSFSSTLQVANKKNYSLVCHTGNCIFVREDILPLLKVPKRYLDYPELLFRYEPMWMPNKISIIRLLVRKILPLSLKIAIMTVVSKLRFSLSKDSIPKND